MWAWLAGSMSEAGFWARKLHKAKKMAHKGSTVARRSQTGTVHSGHVRARLTHVSTSG